MNLTTRISGTETNEYSDVLEKCDDQWGSEE